MNKIKNNSAISMRTAIQGQKSIKQSKFLAFYCSRSLDD
jgi:hypothetical protein